MTSSAASTSTPPPLPNSLIAQKIARAKAVLQATVLDNRLVPDRFKELLSDRQAQFLAYEGREAMYGGAAGGGKSVALLVGALQYAEQPGYHALLLRRTFKMLEKPGALIELSKEWLSGKADWNEQKHKWTFRSGSTLTFGHMEHDRNKFDYQGAAYHYVGYDELTQFGEGMYRYLFSRTRRREGDRVPVRMRSASNPGGVGHEWVKKRFVRPVKGQEWRRLFVPAKMTDNRGLDQVEYLASLDELDPLTRAQLLAGDWDAVEGGRFKSEWFTRTWKWAGDNFVAAGKHVERRRCTIFITVDPAASDDRIARGDDPDYTVICVWALTPDHELLWLDCVRFRKEIPDIVPELQKVYDRWKCAYAAIEAVAANRAVYQIARRTRMTIKQLSPGGLDKLVRATKAMVMAGDNRILVPAHPVAWLEEALAELCRFTGDPEKDGHDDIVDAVAYAAREASGQETQNDGFAPYVAGRL